MRSRSWFRARASASATGEMSETEIEPVMQAFIDGELDVLVATTIIENGIDIPNVNTMVVNDADKFGLAQLYQLRGRVGRSNHQAYCYLLYQGHKALTEEAKARLEAIREFTHLGSGLTDRDARLRDSRRGQSCSARRSRDSSRRSVSTRTAKCSPKRSRSGAA